MALPHRQLVPSCLCHPRDVSDPTVCLALSTVYTLTWSGHCVLMVMAQLAETANTMNWINVGFTFVVAAAWADVRWTQPASKS